MFDAVRNILGWSSKPLRVPNALEAKPDTLYIRALWQRVGGLVGGRKQEDVAKLLGVSLSTLKRYMTKEGSCPYTVQFGLECLAGMDEPGEYYVIRGKGTLCQALLPFAASMSSPSTARIALTLSEKNALAHLAKSEDFPTEIEGPIDTSQPSKVCPLCNAYARFEFVDGGSKKMFDCKNCKRFVISLSAEGTVRADPALQSHFSTRAHQLSELFFLNIKVTRDLNNKHAVQEEAYPRQDFPAWFGRTIF